MLMVTNFGIPFCLNNKYVGTMCEGTMYLLSNYVTDPIYICVDECMCMHAATGQHEFQPRFTQSVYIGATRQSFFCQG